MERIRSLSVRNVARDEEENGSGIERRRKKRANRDNERDGENRSAEKETAIRRTRDVGR